MPQPTRIPNRDQAGSLVMPRPPSKTATTAASNAKNEVAECGGNVLLLEARLCEITSSIRALLRSNEDLDEALRDAPNDPDFLQAVEENKIAIRRQGRVAESLVNEMKTKGAKVDLEEDIEHAISGSNVVVVAERSEEQQASNSSVSNAANAQTENEQPDYSGGVLL